MSSTSKKKDKKKKKETRSKIKISYVVEVLQAENIPSTIKYCKVLWRHRAAGKKGKLPYSPVINDGFALLNEQFSVDLSIKSDKKTNKKKLSLLSFKIIQVDANGNASFNEKSVAQGSINLAEDDIVGPCKDYVTTVVFKGNVKLKLSISSIWLKYNGKKLVKEKKNGVRVTDGSENKMMVGDEEYLLESTEMTETLLDESFSEWTEMEGDSTLASSEESSEKKKPKRRMSISGGRESPIRKSGKSKATIKRLEEEIVRLKSHINDLEEDLIEKEILIDTQSETIESLTEKLSNPEFMINAGLYLQMSQET
eukprot:TRINITY_DN1885_c0_g1_i1.p2 TRINITY_DN1885_c0_g1~~TRINITY_DN1885_c0_g1_i1.p2  ORF type:complete len:311 (-),score=72.04 TRINITY_DN1885_c0_g1_i1:1388-2320(-)